MWEAPLPSSMDRDFLRTGAGFPVLAADEAWVWRPQSYDEGTYNHYACLIHHKGRFYAMWGNHQFGEDLPGQRVLYSVGDTWDNWSERQELFPPPGPVEESGSGIHLKPDRWAVIDDQLYAIAYVHGHGIYPIARLVAEDGTFGNPFIVRRVPSSGGLPDYMEDVDPLNPPPIAKRILQWYRDNDLISWWGRNGWNVPNFAVDHSELIENFIYPTPAQDGEQVLMLRANGTPSNRPIQSNRIYVTFRGSEFEGWADPYPTNIPDSPSRAQAITLDDGTALLIGNQNVNRFDDALYILRDPLTVAVSPDGFTFDRVYALRTGSSGTGYTDPYRFPDVTGRNPGFAYASSIVHDGYLYTLYSHHKEDMGFSRVALGSLGL